MTTPFAGWLNRVMKERGLKPPGLAAAAGVSRSTMHRLLNGHTEPGLSTIDKFAQLLDESRAMVLLSAGYLTTEQIVELCQRLIADGVIDPAQLNLPPRPAVLELAPRPPSYPDRKEFQQIWQIPELDDEERKTAILAIMTLRFDPRRAQQTGGTGSSAASDPLA